MPYVESCKHGGPPTNSSAIQDAMALQMITNQEDMGLVFTAFVGYDSVQTAGALVIIRKVVHEVCAAQARVFLRRWARERESLAKGKAGERLMRLLAALAVDAIWDRNYNFARFFWRARCLVELFRSSGSIRAFKAQIITDPPTPLMSKWALSLRETSSDWGIVHGASKVIPCSCLQEVLAEFRGKEVPADRPPSGWEQPSGVVLKRDWYMLPVMDGDGSSHMDTRLHVEVRFCPPPIPKEDAYMLLALIPSSRTVFAEVMLPPLDVQNGKWVEFAMQKVRQSALLWTRNQGHRTSGGPSCPFRPARITAVDPVLVEVLNEELGDASTVASLADDEEMLPAYKDLQPSPLVSAMHGHAAKAHACLVQGATGEDLYTHLLAQDAAYKPKSKGGFKLDQSAEERAVPSQLWACAHCKQLLHRASLKVCARCKSVRYCSAECQKKHWKKTPSGHKQSCDPKPAHSS